MRAWALIACAGCGFQHGQATAGDDTGGRDASFQDGASDGGSDGPPAGWWNPAWGFRMPITIFNGAPAALPAGYQVGVAHDVGASPCTGNREDPRIVFVTNELTRHIDSVGPPEWLWFKLAVPLAAGATSTGEYWLYCGNPTPNTAPKDPKQVFDFWDGFDTSIDLAVWTTQNDVAVSNGKLVCGGAGRNDSGVVTTTPAFTANHAVDFIAIASSATSSDYWAGFQLGVMDVPPWLHWWTNQPNIIAPDFKATMTSQEWLGTSIPLDTQPHIYSVENYGTSSMYRREDIPVESHVYDTMPPAILSVRLWDGSSATSVSYDWVRVRQAVNPPPLVSVGAPQAY